MPRLPATFVLIALATVLAACSKTAKEPEAAPAPAAESAPVAEANVHAFKIGELSALALRDGGLELPNDNQVFGMGLTPEDVAAVLSASNLPTDKLHLSVQPLLVNAGERVLLFDTGAGGLFGPSTGKVSAAFAEAGVDPASVTDIFISHSHGDHVGGLVNAEGGLAFANATIHMSAPEWQHMSAQEDYKPMAAVLASKVDAFTPGAELIPGLVTAVEIKGHTPGHSGYRIGTGPGAVLYVGDSMHHYVVSVQKPEWAIAFDSGSAEALATRVALIQELAASGQRMYAVHFPFPGVGKLEQRGDVVAWVAE